MQADTMKTFHTLPDRKYVFDNFLAATKLL